MKFLIVFAACVAASVAKPGLVAAPAVIAASPLVSSPISTQYHAQDELGQYTYGYTNPLSSKSEAKAVDGSTVGGYSYVDSNGLVQSVQYAADDVNGFRVAATNLPVGPVSGISDTPEVALAKAHHYAALNEATVRAAVPVAVSQPLISTYAAPYAHYHYHGIPSVVAGPVVPADTPEVAHAKALHFAAVEEAKARNAHAPL